MRSQWSIGIRLSLIRLVRSLEIDLEAGLTMLGCDQTEWRYLKFAADNLRMGDDRYRQIFEEMSSRVLYVNPGKAWVVLKIERSSMRPVEVTEE